MRQARVGGWAALLLLPAALVTGVLAQQPSDPAAPPAPFQQPQPLQVNCDMSGEWSARSREDWEDRALLGTNLGDYTGFPLNDAGRQYARHWDASIRSLHAQQAAPHPAQYNWRGPGPNFRLSKFTDPLTRAFVGYTFDGGFGRADRIIWMDGRPHPPHYAEHTWEGFASGRCERGMLVVTTTHMKQGSHRRNGVPASSKAVTTHYFIRHGTELTLVQFTDDPVYLEEIHVRTTDFQLNPTQNVGPLGLGFETVDEIASWDEGFVPHWPFGSEHYKEFADLLGVPVEATQGFKEAMYPEYLPKLRQLMREMEQQERRE
jgi:hypothetical protein